ncbi:MAG TPA: hypothetical protein VGL35_04685 [Rhizomicrobium sp.]
MADRRVLQVQRRKKQSVGMLRFRTVWISAKGASQNGTGFGPVPAGYGDLSLDGRGFEIAGIEPQRRGNFLSCSRQRAEALPIEVHMCPGATQCRVGVGKTGLPCNRLPEESHGTLHVVLIAFVHKNRPCKKAV